MFGKSSWPKNGENENNGNICSDRHFRELRKNWPFILLCDTRHPFSKDSS